MNGLNIKRAKMEISRLVPTPPTKLKNRSFPVVDRTKTAAKYTESELRSFNACKNTSFVAEVKSNLRCSCRLP